MSIRHLEHEAVEAEIARLKDDTESLRISVLCWLRAWGGDIDPRATERLLEILNDD